MKRTFLNDMTEKKSLAMVNSHQSVRKNPVFEEDAFLIDMGGTNLRFASLTGGMISDTESRKMFGLDTELTADEFFGLIADEIGKRPQRKVGFCYSYPFIPRPDGDALITKFSKELKVRGAEGKLLGEELNRRLDVKRDFAIINDTVAAQLGTEADAAIILGTGFNICFTDPVLNRIVNAECGMYTLFPRGDFDVMMDAELEPGKPVAEKMISGVYLPRLIRITAENYFGRKMADFELRELSGILSGEKTFGVLSESETDDFREICSELMKRGAARAALILSCLLKDYGSGKIRVAIEGSTVYKTPGYMNMLQGEIGKRIPLDIEFADGRDTILRGAAISTL